MKAFFALGTGGTSAAAFVDVSLQCVCVCAYVCCHSIYSGRQVCGRTSRGHTGFLIHPPSAALALIFLARTIQSFLPLVGGDVEYCVLMISSFSPCWAFFFSFSF